jgi:hypothetical protein
LVLLRRPIREGAFLMRKMLIALLTTGFVAAPLFAGALTLQVDDLNSNKEAVAKKAVVVAHMTACHSPEKTTVTATADGIVNGKLQTIPLKVMYLAEPGSFAVAQEWPREGMWTVRLVATNPDYKNYATTVTVPVHNGFVRTAEAKVFYYTSAD